MAENIENFEEMIVGEVTRNRKRLMWFGILSLILGIIGTYMSVAVTMASILILGIFVISVGALLLIEAFSAPEWKGKLGHLILSLLYVIAGITIVAYPGASAVWFTLFLAVFFIMIGMMRIVTGFRIKDELAEWGWMVFGGLLNIILGIMIYSAWPVSGLWVIGLFISIELIIQGVNAIVLSRVVKKSQEVLQ